MEFVIRKAKTSDINNGLFEAFVEGYLHHQEGRPDVFKELKEEELKQELKSRLDNLCNIVITYNNQVAGFVFYEFKEKNMKKIYIDEISVLEKYRRKGLGKRLMEEIYSIGKNNGCDRVELNCWIFNNAAFSMYDSLGYDKQRIIYEKKII